VFPASPLDTEPAGPEPVLEVSVFELLEALRRALARVPPEAIHHQVDLERVTLQERMLAVMDRLRAGPAQHLLFEDLLLDAAPTRHLVVMTFLAILELARIQAVGLFQNQSEAGELRGPIRVRLAVAAAEESGV
jgi:segregation and condensation protein A